MPAREKDIIKETANCFVLKVVDGYDVCINQPHGGYAVRVAHVTTPSAKLDAEHLCSYYQRLIDEEKYCPLTCTHTPKVRKIA